MSQSTITVVLGGGRGTRLHPLTAVRAKPAVPLGGKYRLIDIPISNAINSGLRQIFVLTQFNSASLNAHIAKTYQFDPFSRGFVEVLAAEQTEQSGDWYQGTADAVRQQLHRLRREGVENVLILSGDHLYRMDYAELLARHEEASADITVSSISVDRRGCDGFGVIGCDHDGMITRFVEKPDPAADISDVRVPESLRAIWGLDGDAYLASMGVYVFRLEVLEALLADSAMNDFGGDVLPRALEAYGVAVHLYDGYWEDIGTIGAFYDANLALCDNPPNFRFYDISAPIYTRARFLPPSVLLGAQVERSLVADGCLLLGCTVTHSIVGLRSRVEAGVVIEDSIVMGADWYQSEEHRARLLSEGRVPVGVGEGASIRRAIVDKNVSIGAGAVIHGNPDRPDEDHGHYMVRDGIVIVAKGAVIPAGAVL